MEGSPAWSARLRPVIHMTELNLTFHAEPGGWPLSLSATSSQSRCDHCRLLSCHHTSLNSCETAVSAQAAVLLGHMSSRIYSSWWLPALPGNQYMATCALWLHNSSKRYSAHTDGWEPDNKSETAQLLIFLLLQHFLIEMFTCSTRAFKEKAEASEA